MHYFKLFLFIAFISTAISANAQEATGNNNRTDTITKNKRLEIEAFFPGGNNGWAEFLERKLDSNVPARNDAPAGRYQVMARFIIDKDGSISFADAETNFGYGMEQELIRVIKKSPKWMPATINGSPVRAYRRQPVTFLVEPSGFVIRSLKPYTLFTDTDNEVYIDARKIKPEDLSVTISAGAVSLLESNTGKYIIHVSKPGRVLIELFNTKKNNKKIGAASFEVQVKK